MTQNNGPTPPGRSAGFLKYFRNTSWLFVDKVVRLGAVLITSIFVTRYLGPELFGQLNYASAFVGIFFALTSMGLDDILIGAPRSARAYVVLSKADHVTVDLADVDLWTGNVYSEKLGACASWVVRGSHMKKVEGASLPLGIVEEAAATSTQYRLHSGDILIMVSDGVADAFETDEQFTQALSDSLYIQPQRMADALLRNALLAGGGTPRDDMSVMVLLMLDRQQAKGS